MNNDALASIVEGANSVERGHQVMADHGSKQRKPNFRTAVEDVKALATVFVMNLESVLGRRLMTQKTWSKSLTYPDKLDQLKLVYDYVKFHIQLYLATPAVLALVADGLQVKQDRIFTFGLIGMILVYLAAGIHAGLFMGRHVNDPRQDDFLKRFEQDAFSSGRRFMHHSLYWLGLAIGGGCLALSAARKYL
jgi:hypothetical protein